MIRILMAVIMSTFLLLDASIAAAMDWSAGPGLKPVTENHTYQTMERRQGESTIRVPFYQGKNERLGTALNDRMEKEVDDYLKFLNNDKRPYRVTGWLYWQEGETEPYASVVLLESIMYEGAAHPLTYVKGVTFDENGKRITLADLKAAMPDLTLERLRQETKRQCDERNINMFAENTIDDFPKEFYIGNDGNLYFIFQQYDIAPYVAGWIMINMGRMK